jgi:hypothetical protein
MSISTLRWRLAKAISPLPIIVDPFDGENGVAVVYRQAEVQWSLRADTLRLKSSSSLAKLDLHEDEPWKPTYRPGRTFTRFVGTLSR